MLPLPTPSASPSSMSSTQPAPGNAQCNSSAAQTAAAPSQQLLRSLQLLPTWHAHLACRLCNFCVPIINVKHHASSQVATVGTIYQLLPPCPPHIQAHISCTATLQRATRTQQPAELKHNAYLTSCLCYFCVPINHAQHRACSEVASAGGIVAATNSHQVHQT